MKILLCEKVKNGFEVLITMVKKIKSTFMKAMNEFKELWKVMKLLITYYG